MILFNILLTLVTTVAAAPTDHTKFHEEIINAIWRENTVLRGAPLVFFTAERGADCREVLTGLDTLIDQLTPTYALAIDAVRSQSDVWRHRGSDPGFIDSDNPAPFDHFLKSAPRGAVVGLSGGNLLGEDLVITKWLGPAITKGLWKTDRLDRITFALEAYPALSVHAGVTVATLLDYAVANGEHRGCHYHVINRARAIERIRCELALGTKVTP